MQYTKEQIEIISKQKRTSPFDPKYVWGLPITSDQQEECIRVLARSDMMGAQRVLENFVDFSLHTDQRRETYDNGCREGFVRELKDHWKRWERKYGINNLPDHIRLNGPDAPYPKDFVPPPEYAKYLRAAPVRVRCKDNEMER